MDAPARILDELTALARDGASGALQVDGDPGGAVYLDEGRLVFAEAAGVPDVGARLIGTRRLSPEQWTTLRNRDRPPDGLGPLLVERGLIGRDEMLAVLRSASLDAITALTVPMTTRSSVARLRFTARERPWIGAMLALEIDSVRAEMARRADLLARAAVPLDALVAGADLRRPFAVLRREQWAVAGRIDGVTPLRELAWRNGLALYETVESVGGLLRAGLCTLRTARPAGEDPPWAAAPVLAAPVPVADPPAPGTAPPGEDLAGTAMPRRLPGATLHERRRDEPGLAVPPGPERPGPERPGLDQAATPTVATPTPELLRRLLDGLRRLDLDDPPGR